MVTVTVVRLVPPSIIGVTGVVHDRAFDAFEETLDWLEATGTLVERIDPTQQADALVAHPAARERYERSGTACLPLVIVDGSVVSAGTVPTRSQLAHAVGHHAPDPAPDTDLTPTPVTDDAAQTPGE